MTNADSVRTTEIPALATAYRGYSDVLDFAWKARADAPTNIGVVRPNHHPQLTSRGLRLHSTGLEETRSLWWVESSLTVNRLVRKVFDHISQDVEQSPRRYGGRRVVSHGR